MKRGIFKSAVFLLIILGFSLALAGEVLSQIGLPESYRKEEIVPIHTSDGRLETGTLVTTWNKQTREKREEIFGPLGNLVSREETKSLPDGRASNKSFVKYDMFGGKETKDEFYAYVGKVQTKFESTSTDPNGVKTNLEKEWDPKTKNMTKDNYKKSDKTGNTLGEKTWSLQPDDGTRSSEIKTNPQGQIISLLKEERDANRKNISRVSERYTYDSMGRLVQYYESKTGGAKPAAVYLETRKYEGNSMTQYKAAAQQKGPNDLSLQPTTPRKVLGTSEVKTAAPGAKAPGSQAQPVPAVTPASAKPAQPAEGAARASQKSPAPGAKATVDPKVGALPGKPAGAAATPPAGAKPAAAATPAAPGVAATPPKAATPTAVKPPALPGGAVSTPQAAVSPAAPPKVVAPPPPKAAPPPPVKPPGLPGGAQATPARVTSPPPVAPQKATPPPSPPPKRPGEMR